MPDDVVPTTGPDLRATAAASAWLCQTCEAVGASGGVLLELNPAAHRLEIRAWTGYREVEVASWRHIPMDLPTPLTDAVRSSSAIVVGTQRDLSERYPAFRRTRAGQEVLVAVPVTTPTGACVAVVGLTFADESPVLARADSLAQLGRQAYAVLKASAVLTHDPRPPAGSPPLAASRLQALTAQLSASLTPEAILDVMTDHGRAVLGADMVQISLLSPDQRTFTLLRSRGTNAELYDTFRTFSADAPLPTHDVVQSGLSVIFHKSDMTERWPALADLAISQQSFAVMPLHGESGILGVIGFGWLLRQEFLPSQMALALDLADLCSAALDRAHRYRDEEEARAAAEAVNRRLRALQNLTVHLAGAVEPADVADVFLHEVVDAVGAHACVIAEFDGLVTLKVLACLGLDDAAAATWDSTKPGSGNPLAQRALAGPGPVLDIDDATGGSWAVVRLVAGGRVVGLAAVGWHEPHMPTADEWEFLGAVGAHAAAALDRVALLRGVRMTAETLQRALLPQVLATADGWEVATHYAPAVEGTHVGGDWYDTFRLRDGSVGLVLGDVMGKGLRAASTMGAVRSALRAFASLEADPAAVLARLDTYLATFAVDDIVTCLFAVLDPATGELRYSSAGHLPALVVAADRPPLWLDGATSTPLGVWPAGGGRRTTARTTIRAQDALLLYSDGLVEDRTRHLSAGLAQLAEEATATCGQADLSEAVTALVTSMLAGRRNTDDLAVLVTRRRRAAEGPGAR